MFKLFRKDTQEMIDYIEFVVFKSLSIFKKIDSYDKAGITQHLKEHFPDGKIQLVNTKQSDAEEFWDMYYRAKSQIEMCDAHVKKLLATEKKLADEQKEEFRDFAYAKIKEVYDMISQLKVTTEHMETVFDHLNEKCDNPVN